MSDITYSAGTDAVWLSHNGLISETHLAMKFSIKGRRLWIPKASIIDSDKQVVGVQKWWAKKNRLQGDW